jgi:phage protein D
LIDQPVPTERTPQQQGTDLEHLKQMAQLYGYVFYIKPGPAPFTNRAYWGPPERIDVPQRALSVNVGPETNVESITFTYNALAPTLVKDIIQDSDTNLKLPVITARSTRVPPLVSRPALPPNLSNVRTSFLEDPRSGERHAKAQARAQAMTDRSLDAVVTASGELDALRYGDLLSPRALVGLRGAGYTYDGTYYVKSVSHAIGRGQYKQRFTLTREGVGALTPVVIP